MVAGFERIKLKPPDTGAAAAAGFNITLYPTVLLLRPDGTEVDRVIGFKGPDEFLALLRGMGAGKTFMQDVEKLHRGDGTHDELASAVSSLLERDRAPEAVSLIRAFHHGAIPPCCGFLAWRATASGQASDYDQVVNWWRRRPSLFPAAPWRDASPSLADFLKEFPTPSLGMPEITRRFREARRSDALFLLRKTPTSRLQPRQRLQVAFEGAEYGNEAAAAPILVAALSEAPGEFDEYDRIRASWIVLAGRGNLEVARETVLGVSWSVGAGLPLDLAARIDFELGLKESAILAEKSAARRAAEGGRLDMAFARNAILRGMTAGQKPPPLKRRFDDYPW
ncbi:MAG: hypothetical protein IT186_15605 [Acidobacteria bacterium]|nr:hypothetical protein [Acidobacteriota bacterium]